MTDTGYCVLTHKRCDGECRKHNLLRQWRLKFQNSTLCPCYSDTREKTKKERERK